jgi:fructosamine-3-kinase
VDAEVRATVSSLLATTVTTVQSLSGGDINQAYRVTLADGRDIFVKTNKVSAAGMFRAEARGLEWLGRPGVVRVPAVIAVDDRCLILEMIRSGHPVPSFPEDLGRALAALHMASAPTFGLDHDNFIGRLPQSNRPATRWSDFYRSERLEPQLRRATDAGLISPSLQGRLTRVLTELDDLVGPDEPPARLHGDLWGGNLMCDDNGGPCLIDPAVYGGHREVDLAMMRLFGGFGPGTFAAYDEAFPLAAGHSERVPLYQLYPLLVHVNLFGGSYVGAVQSALSALL